MVHIQKIWSSNHLAYRMKRLIIEIRKDHSEAKKILSRFAMFSFRKASNTFYNYLRHKMKKYIVAERDGYIMCSNLVETKRIAYEVNKLESFLLGDYKKCEIIMQEQGRIKRMFSKLMKLMRGKTVLSYFNLFGILITWRVEDE